MYQVKLNNYKSYDDLGLQVAKDTLSRAIPRQVYQNINGMDGSYNMTTVVHGRVTYEPRTLTVVFTSNSQTEQEYEELCTFLDNIFAGKTVKIVRDCDQGYYLLGEATFESEPNFFTQSHTLTMLCSPYRFFEEETSEAFTVNSTRNVTLDNAKMPVQPTFTTSSDGMSVVFNNTEFSVAPNGFATPEIYLVEGENALKIKGSGTMTISYRQGVL